MLPAMHAQKLALALTLLVAFTLYTVMVAVEHGPLGFLAVHKEGGWNMQVFLDLVLALLGFFTLAAPDAKRHGISHWPYFVAALALGSIGMLAYFVHRELRALRQPALA
jgi:protein-S-isoprenylcysteine O-methyltransferase Ste14